VLGDGLPSTVEEDSAVTDERKQLIREFVDAASHRGTTRREILRRAAILGISAPVIPYVLRSHGALAQDASPVPMAPGSTIVVPQGLRTDLQGQKVNAVLAASASPDKPFLDAALAKFSEATGIQATLIPGEESATDRLAIYNQQLGAQSSDNDVYQIDVIWPGIMAQHAVDLNQSLKDLAAQQFPAIVENNTVDGKLVGMPWFTDAGLLYWRTDLFQKYGIEKGPETWAELEQYAKTIQDGEKSSNPDFQGFVFQGLAYEGLTCDALEWQYSNGGGRIIEPDGTVTVNNPQAIAAFERAHGWVGGISPQDVTTYKEPESLNVFAPGNSAFMRNWPYAYAVTQDASANSPLIGKVDVSPLPKGDGPDARNADCLGGWQMMVSKYSKSQDAAIEFVKYMCSPEVQKAYAVERSHLPTIASIYDDPDVAAASEFMPRLKPVFQGGAVARPSTVSGELYNSVSTAYFQRVNQVLTGSKSAEDAAKEIESELKDIMSQL
jgi:trehalose/maltose transport system substrate-binding protein